MEGQGMEGQYPGNSIYYPEDYDPSLNGINGWLVVVVFGRFIAIVLAVVGIVQTAAYLGKTTMDNILWMLIVFSVVVDILGSCAILILMFKQRILFRTLFVIQAIVTVIGMAVIAGTLELSTYNPIGSVIGCVVWIVYLYKSKRVRNTFIYPYEYPERIDNR